MKSTLTVSDIDGNTYETVQIGNQLCMAENLNVSMFSNGDPIPEAKTHKEWQKAGEEGKPAWCYYDNYPVNGELYGKLYNWYAVIDPRGFAPEGWRVPSDKEWTTLTEFLGGLDVTGRKMKSTNGWQANGNGTNESGFSGLPGGFRFSTGGFYYLGGVCCWWSSSEASTSSVWCRSLYYNSRKLARHSGKRQDGLSVRCIRDLI